MADFNPDCAAWVYDTIAKMDDDEALAFGLLVAHDLWTRDMEGNERFVRSHQERQDAIYTEDVAKALLEHLEAGGDPEEAVGIAAAVAVAKDDRDLWRFQTRDKAGRWGRMTGAQYRAKVAQVKAGNKAARADLKAERKGYLSSANEHGGLYGDVRSVGRETRDSARRFEQGWNQAPSESGATDTFRRLSTGGQLVQQLGAATGSNKTAIAGAVANYAGQFGPEAEKVVGPSVRRAAYRYRGTERTPDRQYLYLAQQNLNGIKRGEKATPAEKTFAAELSAVQYFQGGAVDGKRGKPRIPSPSLAGLHRASGRVTPSEGILIDAQGNVAHQAVGYGEDHYLPFNLKNLSALKGGSYVRTRESGGLTTEDIYTGLVSGARSMTVVSNSGVFTVDFADDLRGGRRYNDKARQMVKRYGQTLDAIQSEKVANPERSMSSWEKAHLRIEAEKKIDSDPLLSTFSADEKAKWVEAEVQRAVESPKLNAKDIADIEARAKEQGKTLSEQQVLARQMYDEKSAALSQRTYRLDGQGYATALDALREQFPYFIGGVHYQHVDSNDSLAPGRYNRGTDQGYVKPRFNRPAAAQAGYFDASIEGRGKTSADRTDYQNLRARKRSEGSVDTSQPNAQAPDKPKAGETADQARERMAGQAKQREEATRYATEVGKDARSWLRTDDEYGGDLNIGDHDVLDEFRGMDADAQKAFLSDPTRVNALAKDLDALEKKMGKRINEDEVPRNRHNFARKAKPVDVSTVASGSTSPIAPPAIEAKSLDALKQDQEFLKLVGMEDNELRSTSDVLRQRRDTAPEGEKQKITEGITRLEQARAFKAASRTEMTAEQYQAGADAAASKGTLRPLDTVGPKQVSSGGSLNDRLVRLRDDYQSGKIEREQFYGDAMDLINDSDMAEHVKDGMYFELTGNRRR